MYNRKRFLKAITSQRRIVRHVDERKAERRIPSSKPRAPLVPAPVAILERVRAEPGADRLGRPDQHGPVRNLDDRGLRHCQHLDRDRDHYGHFRNDQLLVEAPADVERSGLGLGDSHCRGGKLVRERQLHLQPGSQRGQFFFFFSYLLSSFLPPGSGTFCRKEKFRKKSPIRVCIYIFLSNFFSLPVLSFESYDFISVFFFYFEFNSFS